MKHYFESLEEAIRKNWKNPALSDYLGETFTFGMLASSIEKIHIFLELAGIRKGDKVALCARNSARWAVTFLGANTYESIVVPLLADFTPDNINSLVTHSESRLLFTDTEMWRKLDIMKMPGLIAVVSVNDFSVLWAADSKLTQIHEEIGKIFSQRHRGGLLPDEVSYPKDNAKKIALINYTSGTTSAPKGVMIRYESLSSNITIGHNMLPTRNGDALISMLPMAHMYGLVFELIYPICDGVHITYLSKTPTPRTLMVALKKVRPYLIMTVPLVIEKIFKNNVIPQAEKPVNKFLLAVPGVHGVMRKIFHRRIMAGFGGRVRYIVIGGAALSPQVEKYLHMFGMPYSVGYGMTEAAPLLGFERVGKYVMHSCGKAVGDMKIRIDSEDPQNVPGEIQAYGVNVMEGYFKNELATGAAFTDDGWLRTGDLGVIDPQGNIYIRGRSKNMILSANGQNIYPEEIEAIINTSPYVLESVVVDRYPSLVALVHLDKKRLEKDSVDNEGLQNILDLMHSIVNRQLPSYSQIAKFEVVDEPFAKTPKFSIKRYLYK
ncbi:MAG: AMP-binding protein [Bacteroidales bacterium]|nr:AMP-binding protein [Bacteroidales bacterium]